MPSARYLLVEGVDGHPVVDPHNPASNPARYVGWRLSPACAYEGGKCKAHPDPDHVLEHYEQEKQVVLDHPALKKAIAAGDLRKLGETVAKNHEAARAALTKSER